MTQRVSLIKRSMPGVELSIFTLKTSKLLNSNVYIVPVWLHLGFCYLIPRLPKRKGGGDCLRINSSC